MILFMWQDDIIGVAWFIDACLGKAYTSAGPPVGDQFSPELTGKDVMILPLLTPLHCCAQDAYCAISATFGNETQGVFTHPAEIFNFQKLLSVPNPFNTDLSMFTSTAAASASPFTSEPLFKPGRSLTLRMIASREEVVTLSMQG